MRRPNDPTGGIERPPAEPEPMLVPPTASDATTGAPSNEPAGAEGAGEPSRDLPAAPSATPDEDATAAAATAPVAERGVATAAGAAAVATAPALDDG